MPQNKPKYISTDPNAGQATKYLSTDPNAGQQVSPSAAPPPASVPSFASSNPTESYAKYIAQQAGQGLIGAGKGALNTVGTIGKYLTSWAFSPQQNQQADAQMAALTAPKNTAQKVGYGGEQVGEFLIPGLGEEDTANLASKLPFIGRTLAEHPQLANYGADVLRSGTQSATQGTGFLPGAAAGAVGGAIGQGARTIGGKIARGAAGVTEKQLRYGASPEDEILNLPGIRPATLKASAAAKATQLTSEMEQKLDQAKQGVNLLPAKQVVMDAVNKASSQNDLTTINHLQPLFDQISSLPDQAPARQALEYKRGLNSLTKFNQLAPVTDNAKNAARSAYHAVDSEIDKVSPEANELNDRIQNLLTISGARGGGHMGLGKYIVPWFLGHAAGAAGAGPMGELAAMGLAGAAETPTARIAGGKLIGKGVPATIRGSYPIFLQNVLPQVSGNQ